MNAHAPIPFQTGEKYRLITRSDMDGLVCGVLLKAMDLIDDIMFAHPKDMQDGVIEVGPRDITTNLPYCAGVHMCFDHHASETTRVQGDPDNRVIDAHAPSAARVVYNYFGGRDNPAFAHISEDMMKAVDKADAAQFSREDILHPENWELLSFIMDSRTGLGRFRDFNVSNYQLMMNLIDYCRTHGNIEEILQLPDVAERVKLYREHQMRFREQIQRCAVIRKNLIILDLRDEGQIWAGNRFVIYALYPQCNISMHVLWGKGMQNTVFAVGKSILNRTARTDVGALMLEYGGGGHQAAGTCQIENNRAGKIKDELIARITSDG